MRGKEDLAIDGSYDTLRSVWGEEQPDGRLKAAGDTYILFVEWDKQGRLSSDSIHQFGSATLDPTSLHYADQLPLFVEKKPNRCGSPKPSWPGISNASTGHAAGALITRPAEMHWLYRLESGDSLLHRNSPCEHSLCEMYALRDKQLQTVRSSGLNTASPPRLRARRPTADA